MKTSLLILISLFYTTLTWAVPAENRLVTPDRVEVVGKQLKITYTLLCEKNDAISYVFSNDDSGDLIVAVGVVYSHTRRNCNPQNNTKQFSDTVNPKQYGYGMNEGEFVPMPTNTNSKKLRDYVVQRIEKRKGGRSLMEILEKDHSLEKDKVVVVVSSFECIGRPGTENEYKDVGVCTFRVIDKGSSGEHYDGAFSLTISDDPEHPGTSRNWDVNFITASF